MYVYNIGSSEKHSDCGRIKTVYSDQKEEQGKGV